LVFLQDILQAAPHLGGPKFLFLKENSANAFGYT